jgi:2-dehydropantoate 2-reductase
MAVDPIPPGWDGDCEAEESYKSWVEGIIAFYGDIKPSMLQDFERFRKTEIDFINGYGARLGRESGMPVKMNGAITELVHQVERGEIRAAPERMNDLGRFAID